MKIMPNQIVAHQTASDAWDYAKRLINSFGESVITEDRKLTKEIQNMHLCILNPLAGWPVVGSGWNMEGLQKYAEQLLSGENTSCFSYTYGERLRFYPNEDGIYKIDQIDFCIDLLKKNQSTRRAVAITWVPDWDLLQEEVPCLQLLDFLIRGGRLNMTTFFRSWDCGRAAVPNMYGLAKLMEHVGKEVNAPIGSLTIVAASAHVYES